MPLYQASELDPLLKSFLRDYVRSGSFHIAEHLRVSIEVGIECHHGDRDPR